MNKVKIEDLTTLITKEELQGNPVIDYEHQIMATLIKYYNDSIKNCLEIGTSDGYMAVTIKRELNPKSIFKSIDITDRAGIEYRKRFKSYHSSLFSCGSENFDYKFHGPFDFVYIDGDHTTKGLMNDTYKVLPNMNPKGIVVWHDYNNVDDVTKFLDDLSDTFKLVNIEGTHFVVHGMV